MYGNQVVFKSRDETGGLLAEKLAALQLINPIVIAIPRGGVVIGCEIARRIGAELDIVTPKKIPAPQNPELAIGAVMHDGSFFLNEEVAAASNASKAYIESAKERVRNESARRLSIYRRERAPPVLRGRTVILTDDGIATGSTMEVAIKWAREQNSERVIVAVPVIPTSILAKLKRYVDSVVYVEATESFFAIGQFYKIFEQVSDEEVIRMLQDYWKNYSKDKKPA
jgi:predicted phosphoribosyltransferase